MCGNIFGVLNFLQFTHGAQVLRVENNSKTKHKNKLRQPDTLEVGPQRSKSQLETEVTFTSTPTYACMCVCVDRANVSQRSNSKMFSSIATTTAKSAIIALASATGSAVGAANAFGRTIHTHIFAKQAQLPLIHTCAQSHKHTDNCECVCVVICLLVC